LQAMLLAIALPILDESGRRLLTTGTSWDQEGPRVIALSPKGEKRVGMVRLLGVIVLAALLLLAIANIEWILPFIVVGAVLS
ncbi:hypothetical protein K3W91_15260, partial [Listeria monocytogenes]|nr:hypothetical protein [Listeria monocytogenes]